MNFIIANNELLAIKLILDEVGVTKVKHPNKGHTPNKGQKPMYQGVRYSESPLYSMWMLVSLILS